MNPHYDIPTYKEEETELFKCCISEDLLEREELYYNSLPGEYFKKELIDKYIEDVGLPFCLAAKLKNLIIKENK